MVKNYDLNERIIEQLRKTFEKIAEECFKQADAMLAESKKE